MEGVLRPPNVLPAPREAVLPLAGIEEHRARPPRLPDIAVALEDASLLPRRGNCQSRPPQEDQTKSVAPHAVSSFRTESTPPRCSLPSHALPKTGLCR